VTFLLDVSVLVSLAVFDHEFHGRAADWMNGLAEDGPPDLATCSITELGFVRVLAQAPQYGLTAGQARQLLMRIKANPEVRFTFLADGNDVAQLPAWVRTPKQVTDGHLVQLARTHGARLATFGRGIPGAVLVG
jgi:toxin-antitoxin system PIN domain toxin